MSKKDDFFIIAYADDHKIMKSFKPSDRVKSLSNQLRNCFLRLQIWISDFTVLLETESKNQIIERSHKEGRVIRNERPKMRLMKLVLFQENKNFKE